MIREAESHAEEDRKRREEAEVRNQADTLVYYTEKLLNEQGDKGTAGGPDRDRDRHQGAQGRPRRHRRRRDQRTHESLVTASQGFSTRLYQQGAARRVPAAPPGASRATATAPAGRGRRRRDRRRGPGAVTHADPRAGGRRPRTVPDPGPTGDRPDGPSSLDEAEAGVERPRSCSTPPAASSSCSRAERDEYLDHLRRLQAEFDNFRKRTLRDQTARLERAEGL